MDAVTSHRLMVFELSVLGTISAIAVVVTVTPVGPAIFDGPIEAAIDLRPLALLAAACLVAGVRLGVRLIRAPEQLALTSKAWWALGWIGAFAMACVLGAWIYQVASGERIGIGPDDPPELHPFGGPTRAYAQYQLRMAAFGVPLLVPWIHLLWARRKVLRSNSSLERSRDR